MNPPTKQDHWFHRLVAADHALATDGLSYAGNVLQALWPWGTNRRRGLDSGSAGHILCLSVAPHGQRQKQESHDEKG